MSKIALITDSHAGVRNDNPVFHEYQKRCFAWFFDYIDDYNIKTVIHLGDIYDKRKQINIMSGKRLREDFLLPLVERNIETHIIQGNHDSFFKNTHEVNALDELITGRYGNISTYSIPRIINIDGLDIQILPWITASNYDASMEAIKNPRAEIAMGHLELSGFVMHKGEISQDGLSAGLFENFDRVFSGHFHHRSSRGNITYLGAFAEYTWLDYNDPRGFNVFDTETRQLEFIQNPHRMFAQIVYDDVNNYYINHEQSDFDVFKNKYVKLIVAERKDQYQFDIFLDKLSKAGPLDIQIVDDPTLLVTDENEDVNEAQDTPTILRDYVEGLTLSVNKGKMKNFMLEVYKEALMVET